MSATAADAPETALDSVLPPPSLRRLAVVALPVLVLGLGGLLGWAAVTPLERAVVGVGALVAEGRRKTITLLEPGILRELLVREGERVAVGQTLLRLDTTQAETTANQARAQVWTQTARIGRLRAEQADSRTMDAPAGAAEAAADPAIAALLEAEAGLFAARWGAFDGAMAVQRTRIAQLQEQAAALAAQRSATATRLRAVREELAGVNHLLARGFATRTRQWEMQRAEAELLGNLGQYQAQEAQTREQVAQAEWERANLRLNRRLSHARRAPGGFAPRRRAHRRGVRHRPAGLARGARPLPRCAAARRRRPAPHHRERRLNRSKGVPGP